MTAGFTGFTKVLTEEASRAVNECGDYLRDALNAAIDRHGVAATVLGRGSLMNIHFIDGPVDTPAPLDAQDPRLLALWHVEMMLRGYHTTPRGMLALSIPFGKAEADGFVDAFDDFLSVHRSLLPSRTA